jgi:quinol monooxygenase YgiN
MDALGFLTLLEARAGKADAVADFLTSTAKPLADTEPGTLLWFAFRSGPNSFGVFDLFADEVARDVHLHGEVRQALDARSDELFSQAPQIIPIQTLASKLPADWPAVEEAKSL